MCLCFLSAIIEANSEELLAEIVVKKAMCYIEISDLDHAEQQLNSVLKLDNIWATEAYFLLGRVLQARGKWVPSLEMFNKALRRDPKHIDTYLARLSTYTALGKEDLALNDRKMAILLRREKLWTRQSVVMDGAKVPKK
jgi:tetratricopeptide (TPR) repeat protein